MERTELSKEKTGVFTGAFALIETVEILMRPWNIDGPSVRPAHRMVAHTGFLTTARRIQGSRETGSAEADLEEIGPEDQEITAR